MGRVFSILSGVVLMLLGNVEANQAVPNYPAVQIAPRTWVIHGPTGIPSEQNRGFMNNPTFSVTANGVVVVDPGSSRQIGEMLLRQIRKVTKKPVSHVLNTHIHGDHWLGNHAIAQAFPSAKFHAHPKMIEQAHDGEARIWLTLLLKMTDGATAGTEAIVPTHELFDGQELVVDDLTFRIYSSKHAHTQTDVMIEVVQDAVMILGDNVSMQRLGRMDDGSFRGNINACERARQSTAKVFVPGHGPTGDASTVLVYCDYLSDLYREVGVLAEQGMADFEMKAHLLPKFAAFANWAGFESGFGKHVSLAMLEYENASFE